MVVSVSVFDCLVKAAAGAMQSVPAVNASWMYTFVRQYDNVSDQEVARGRVVIIYLILTHKPWLSFSLFVVVDDDDDDDVVDVI